MKLIIFGLIGFAMAGSVYADSEVESLSNISGELVNIRQEIEELHGKVNQMKELYSDEVRSLSSRKTDLEVRIGRTELNARELKTELDQIARQNSEKYQSSEQIVPVLSQAIVQLRIIVQQDLPFKRDERLQALNDIESRMLANTISPNKAVNQLWAFVEDELMLGKSTGLYNDLVEVEGEHKLLKVLRIGKVASFYRTNESQYGVIRRTSQGWESQLLSDTQSARQLDEIFDSFTKNIRNGMFTVPNFLPES